VRQFGLTDVTTHLGKKSLLNDILIFPLLKYVKLDICIDDIYCFVALAVIIKK